MRFTLAQLEAFYWIAQLGKFQDAARHLNLTQPTISLRVHALEQTLGVTLFDRAGRDVGLSPDGKALFELARSVLLDAWRIPETIGGTAVRGTFKLGMPENFARTCLSELLRVLRRDHSELTLELAIGTSGNLSRDLEEHRLSAAVLGNPHTAGARDLEFVPLGRHPMVWACPAGLEFRGPITPTRIFNLPVLCNPEPELQYQMITDWFRSDGVAPKTLNTCNSVSVIAELVAAGVGVSMLPTSILQPHLDAGHVRILRSRPAGPFVHFFFGYHASSRGATVAAVLAAARDVIGRVPFLEPERARTPSSRLKRLDGIARTAPR